MRSWLLGGDTKTLLLSVRRSLLEEAQHSTKQGEANCTRRRTAVTTAAVASGIVCECVLKDRAGCGVAGCTQAVYSGDAAAAPVAVGRFSEAAIVEGDEPEARVWQFKCAF